MTQIRINPTMLCQSAGNLSVIETELQKLGGDLWQSSVNAPAYDGQFQPRLLGISQAALAQAKSHASLIGGFSSTLTRKANAFQTIDAAGAMGLQTGADLLLNLRTADLLRYLSMILGLPIAVIARLLRLGMLNQVIEGMGGLVRIGWIFEYWKKIFGRKQETTEESEQTKNQNWVESPVQDTSLPVKAITAVSPFIGGYLVTGSWGVYFNGTKIHNGVDLKPKTAGATDVHPVGPGKVIKSGFDADGYGYYVTIEHRLSDGRVIHTTYAHMKAQSTLSVGDTVTSDTKIGEMGSTGHSTGPHLHLDIHEVGKGSYDYQNHAPNEKMADGRTYLERMQSQWIDPVSVISGESGMSFLPVSEW